jgi:tripartite-type tricarboxylate transporter receptor subunit TctC
MLCALGCLLLVPAGAVAQTYPVRPIRLIVPFPPGGPNDLLARLVGQLLQESLGQQAIVDNRGGAGGAIGAEIAARAAPDGHTLLFGGPAVMSINPAMNPRLAYDPIRDFAPVGIVATAPSVLVVHPALPVKSVRDLIDMARAAPGRINYASAGVGTNPHLAGELFKFMAGVNLVHVPYKGAGPAMTDVLAGQVPVYFAGISGAVPFLAEGRLRAIAVTGTARTALLPDTPTFAESGLPGYEVNNWYAVLAPRATAPALVATLNAAIVKGLGTPDMRRRIHDLGAQPAGSSPQVLADTMRTEIAKWTKVIRAANIRAE